jgi:hypothetical protein
MELAELILLLAQLLQRAAVMEDSLTLEQAQDQMVQTAAQAAVVVVDQVELD